MWSTQLQHKNKQHSEKLAQGSSSPRFQSPLWSTLGSCQAQEWPSTALAFLLHRMEAIRQILPSLEGWFRRENQLIMQKCSKKCLRCSQNYKLKSVQDRRAQGRNWRPSFAVPSSIWHLSQKACCCCLSSPHFPLRIQRLFITAVQSPQEAGRPSPVCCAPLHVSCPAEAGNPLLPCGPRVGYLAPCHSCFPHYLFPSLLYIPPGGRW